MPFYWARFEPERGKPITEKVKNAARYCLEHNMITKGHPLCWHTLTADWLLEMSNAEILEAQIARKAEVKAEKLAAPKTDHPKHKRAASDPMKKRAKREKKLAAATVEEE